MKTDFDVVLSNFAEDERQLKELQDLQKLRRQKILNHLVEIKEKTAETPFGKFTVTDRKTWTYTEKVTKLEDRAKTEKAKEQQKGVATFIISTGLTFTAPKEEK